MTRPKLTLLEGGKARGAKRRGRPRTRPHECDPPEEGWHVFKIKRIDGRLQRVYVSRHLSKASAKRAFDVLMVEHQKALARQWLEERGPFVVTTHVFDRVQYWVAFKDLCTYIAPARSFARLAGA